MVRSVDGDTDFRNIFARVFQRYTQATYFFIICLENVLRTSINQRLKNGFTLKKQDAETLSGANYEDDLVILANTAAQAESLVHSLEQSAGSISLRVNANITEYEF